MISLIMRERRYGGTRRISEQCSRGIFKVVQNEKKILGMRDFFFFFDSEIPF